MVSKTSVVPDNDDDEDDDGFGTPKAGLLPPNPMQSKAWQGLDQQQVNDYLDAVGRPAAEDTLSLFGLSAGIAGRNTVAINMPRAGVIRAAGSSVVVSQDGRSAQATGGRARVMSVMPRAGQATAVYMKRGEAYVQVAHLHDSKNERAVSPSPIHPSSGKQRASTLLASHQDPLDVEMSPPRSAVTSPKRRGGRRPQKRAQANSTSSIGDVAAPTPSATTWNSKRLRSESASVAADALGQTSTLASTRFIPGPRAAAASARHHGQTSRLDIGDQHRPYPPQVDRVLRRANDAYFVDFTIEDLKSTALFGVAKEIWGDLCSWGIGIVEILKMVVKADRSNWPRKALPCKKSDRPPSVQQMVTTGRVMQGSVWAVHDDDSFPGLFDDWWLLLCPPGQVRFNGRFAAPSGDLPDSAWDRLRVAGPNGIVMIAIGLILWRMRIDDDRIKLQQWGWMVMDVRRVFKVLVRNISSPDAQDGNDSDDGNNSDECNNGGSSRPVDYSSELEIVGVRSSKLQPVHVYKSSAHRSTTSSSSSRRPAARVTTLSTRCSAAGLSASTSAARSSTSNAVASSSSTSGRAS
jgi:hypothetical protein